MIDPQFQDHHEHEEEEGQEVETTGRLRGNWRSCLLLTVMVLGLLATPLALLYRWYDERPEFRFLQSASQDGSVDRIAFVTLDHQLATIRPDGRDARRLTDMNRRVEFPAWAPDGSQLAVIAGEIVYLVPDEEVAPDRNQAAQVYADTQEPPFYLYWSPDSQYVSFLASHPDGIALHLLRASADAPDEAMLAVGQPFYWDWAPTADKLFIHSGSSDNNPRLAVIDLAGESAGDEFGDPGFFQAPGISPSGRYRAFAELDEVGRSRLVVQDEGGEKAWLETHAGQLAMTWSPQDELLAYMSPRLNAGLIGGPLKIFDPAENESDVLSSDNVLAYFWSPDGQHIAYLTLGLDEDNNVRVVEAADKRRIMARQQRQQGGFSLELWAIDVDGGQRRQLAQFVPSRTFLGQFLPYFDQYALSHRLWSPDSDALVIPVLEDGRSQLAVVPLDGGRAQLIADGQIGFWSHQ